VGEEVARPVVDVLLVVVSALLRIHLVVEVETLGSIVRCSVGIVAGSP
jgi:hypothetical protein